jgi:hypothetical protein
VALLARLGTIFSSICPSFVFYISGRFCALTQTETERPIGDQMMPTVKDLGRKIKKKYPGRYDDMPSEEVGMLVKQKYPGQYDDYTNLPSVFSEKQYPSQLGEYQPQPNVMPPVPAAPSDKGLYILLGIILSLGGLYCLIQFNILVGLLFLGVSIFFFVIASNADETHAKNMRLRADSQEQWTRTEVARVATETARHTAQRNADLQEGQHLVAVEQAKALYISNQLQQLETRLKGELAPIAKKLGVSIDTVYQYNAIRMMNEAELEHKHKLNELDLLKQWKEAEQKLRAADLLVLAANQQIKELLTDYETYVRRLDRLEKDKTMSEAGRTKMRGQLKGYLHDIEKRINTLRTRPVLSQDREKARRPGKSNSNSRPEYPPEAN